MVCDAPTISAVLPMFLEFARGAVLVAHNAQVRHGISAGRRRSVRHPLMVTSADAVHRPAGPAVVSREEAPSVRLAALARLFAVASEPTHRALDDARATVEVLHALIERVGNLGVFTFAELRSHLPDVSQAQRRKRVLAEVCRAGPGCPCFAGRATRCFTSVPQSICGAG